MSALGSAAFAQIDPRAQALLDGFQESFSHLEGTVPEDVTSMDLTLCFTFFEAGEAQPESCTRMVMDRANHRLMQELRMTVEGDAGPEEHVITTVYRDGQLMMRDSTVGEAFELPESQLEVLEATFESIFDEFAEMQAAFPEAFERATYDGEVDYGGVLVGEQVTATMPIPNFMTGGAAVQERAVRLVFGAQGRLIGSVIEAPEGDLVMVYDDLEEAPLPIVNHTLYRLEGDTALIQARTRVTHVAFNEPLDDALFELD
jgi:hypothetical protein